MDKNGKGETGVEFGEVTIGKPSCNSFNYKIERKPLALRIGTLKRIRDFRYLVRNNGK